MVAPRSDPDAEIWMGSLGFHACAAWGRGGLVWSSFGLDLRSGDGRAGKTNAARARPSGGDAEQEQVRGRGRGFSWISIHLGFGKINILTGGTRPAGRGTGLTWRIARRRICDTGLWVPLESEQAIGWKGTRHVSFSFRERQLL